MKERKKIWQRKRPIAVTVVAWGIVVLFLIRLYQVFEPLMRMDVLEHGLDGPLTAGMRLTPLGTAHPGELVCKSNSRSGWEAPR